MNDPKKLSYNPVSLIRKKRNKERLTRDEIRYIIDSYSANKLPDYQMSAFLMAAFLNGLNDEESSALTESMLYSGDVLDLSEIPGIKVDKHSTGGVGDKLSLLLAPIVASCGVPVPMISGRGLGHTGGTLDKLESIPGFRTDLDLKRYREVLQKYNLVLIGQTAEIAPADKKIYALRDVTATVESIPLIASSIMSKKLAEGINALVLDVKVGSGAFMKTKIEAQKLAEKLVAIGHQFDKQTIAYLTNMDQPLGRYIGNWLEVKESVEGLTGNGPEDVMELTHLLSGTMIYLGKKADSVEQGVEMSRKAVDSGEAFERFKALAAEQGGDTSYLDDLGAYPQASHQFDLKAFQDGYISQYDAYNIGMAALELGAGRKTKEDDVDPAAGIEMIKKTGDPVQKGETIIRCYTNKKETESAASELLESSVTISSSRPDEIPLITHRIDQNGVTEFQRLADSAKNAK